MYQIEEVDFGYKITFTGKVREKEIQEWFEESKIILETAPETFGVFVDMRDVITFPPESQMVLLQGQQLYRQKGMERSVVVVNKMITKMQFIRLASESGIRNHERYICAPETPDWKAIGMQWILEGVEPD